MARPMPLLPPVTNTLFPFNPRSIAASTRSCRGLRVSPQAATVHGDVTAFTFLIVLFAVGAVVTALLYPRRTEPPRTDSQSTGHLADGHQPASA